MYRKSNSYLLLYIVILYYSIFNQCPDGDNINIQISNLYIYLYSYSVG